MIEDDAPLCFSCASCKLFVWRDEGGKECKKRFENPDFVMLDDGRLAKVKCVFNRMFVAMPSQMDLCPDFETPEDAAKREQRERQRSK